jgi:peptidoglycan/xylan/chitin deacetylase (PgdA/CDA1 family)
MENSLRLWACLTAALLISVIGVGAASQEAVARQIAVTIDDLPVNYMTELGVAGWEKVTSGLLGQLREHSVPAIGFVNMGKLYTKDGRLDERRVSLLTRWLEAGFELGNHTFSHLDLHETSLPEFKKDLLRDEDILRGLSEDHGRELVFFRHPLLHTGRSLETKHGLEDILAEHGYKVAPVTMDNSEWIYARAYDIVNLKGDTGLKRRIAAAYLEYMERVVAYYESQSRALLGREIKQVLLILANTLNSKHFGDLARILKKRGYEFISLSEALNDRAYSLPDRYTGPAGITWLHRWALTQGRSGDFFAGEPEVDAFVNDIYRGNY